MDRDLVNVCNFLKTKNVLIPSQNEWLRSCVEYFKSATPSYDIGSLKNFVYDQWLLADLEDIRASSLPNNCSSISYLTLQGKYCVQLSSAINVAESFYKQLHKIRSPDAEGNLEVGEEKFVQEGRKKRCLKFEITDGVSKLTGFEDNPIPQLVEPVNPGLKVILVGPFECRNSVCMLKANNVQVLGGEVDTLIIPNAVENILARSLGQKENPDPYKSYTLQPTKEVVIVDSDDEDDSALLMVADEIESSVPNQNPTCRNNSLNSAIIISEELDSFGDEFESHGNEDISELQYDFDDDEFELIAAQTASMAENKASAEMRVKTPKHQTTLHNFLSPSVTRTEQNNQVSRTQSACETRKKSEPPLQKPKTETEVRKSSQFMVPVKDSNGNSRKHMRVSDSSNDSMIDPSYSQASTVDCEWRPCLQNASLEMPRPSHEKGKILIDFLKDQHSVEELLKSDSPGPVESPQPKPMPRQTLCEPFPPRTFPSERTVFGSVVKLPQKLSVRDDNWCLVAIILAKGIELEVDFSANALNKIFGITAAEIKAKKDEVRENPEMKEKINEILKVSQLKMKNLKCNMLIRFSSFIGKPIVLDVFEN